MATTLRLESSLRHRSRTPSPDIPIVDAVGGRVLLTSRDTAVEDFVGLWERWAEATALALREGGDVPPPPAPPPIPRGYVVPPHLMARLTEAATFAAAFLARGAASNRELRQTVGEYEEELSHSREEMQRLEELLQMLAATGHVGWEGRRLLGVPLWTPPDGPGGEGQEDPASISPRGDQQKEPGTPRHTPRRSPRDSQEVLANRCACGNVFMADAVYCRKCGRRRNPFSEKDWPEATWMEAGTGGNMPMELQRLQAALRDSEAGRLDVMERLRWLQVRGWQHGLWQYEEQRHYDPGRPGPAAPDEAHAMAAASRSPRSPRVVAPSPRATAPGLVPWSPGPLGEGSADGASVSDMLQLLSIHGQHPDVRAGASATLRQYGVPGFEGCAAPVDDCQEVPSRAPDAADADFYGARGRRGDVDDDWADADFYKGRDYRGQESSDRLASFGRTPEPDDLERRKPERTDGWDAVESVVPPRGPVTPEVEAVQERQRRRDFDRSGSRGGGKPQPSSKRYPRTGLEFSDEEDDSSPEPIGGLRTFGQGFDLDSLSSDSSSDEDLLLSSRGNTRGRFKASGGVMTALRRFDQEILELCHALGGKGPGRQPPNYPPERRGKKHKAARRRELVDSDQEVPVRRDYQGAVPVMPGLVDPEGGTGFGYSLQAGAQARLDLAAEGTRQAAPAVLGARQAAPAVDGQSARIQVDFAGANHGFERQGVASGRRPRNAPAREAPRAVSDQVAAQRAAEYRRKQIWHVTMGEGG